MTGVADASDWTGRGIRGWFWDPNAPARRVPGLFEFNADDSPTVMLWDAIDEIGTVENGVVTVHGPTVQRHSIVIGMTDLGAITLVGCVSEFLIPSSGDGRSYKCPGQLRAQLAYLGEELPTARARTHSALYLAIDGLDLLAGLPVGTWKSNRRSSNISIQHQVGRLARTDRYRFSFETEVNFKQVDNAVLARRRPLLSVATTVKITSATRKSLDEWLSGAVHPLMGLLAFSFGARPALREMASSRPRIAEDHHPRDPRPIPIIGSGIGQTDGASVSIPTQSPLVRLVDLPQGKDLVTAWFDIWSDERNKDVLYRLEQANRVRTHPKLFFSNAIEAVEGWHKAHSPSSNMSLRERLDALNSSMPRPVEPHFGQLDTASVVRMRNDVMHGDVLPDLGDAARQARHLRRILRFHILVTLGMEPDVAEWRATNAEGW